MRSQCSHCHSELVEGWHFCPNCGVAPAREDSIEATGQEHSVIVPEPEDAPVSGVFGGLLFGVLAVPVLIVVGALLCFLPLGFIVGIPLLIAAILAPALGLEMGLSSPKRSDLEEGPAPSKG